MKNLKLILIVMFGGTAVAGSLPAASEAPPVQQLLCAVISTASCAPASACTTGVAEDLNLPQFIRIDFAQKKIQGVRPSGEDTSSIIESSYHHEGMLVLQGMENRQGWTIAIHEADGKMTASAAGKESVLVAFGACTVP